MVYENHGDASATVALAAAAAAATGTAATAATATAAAAAAVTAAAATGATAAGVHSFNFQRFHNIGVLNSNVDSFHHSFRFAGRISFLDAC